MERSAIRVRASPHSPRIPHLHAGYSCCIAGANSLWIVQHLSAGITNETLTVVSRRHEGRFDLLGRHTIGARSDIAIEDRRTAAKDDRSLPQDKRACRGAAHASRIKPRLRCGSLRNARIQGQPRDETRGKTDDVRTCDPQRSVADAPETSCHVMQQSANDVLIYLTVRSLARACRVAKGARFDSSHVGKIVRAPCARGNASADDFAPLRLTHDK